MKILKAETVEKAGEVSFNVTVSVSRRDWNRLTSDETKQDLGKQIGAAVVQAISVFWA